MWSAPEGRLMVRARDVLIGDSIGTIGSCVVALELGLAALFVVACVSWVASLVASGSVLISERGSSERQSHE
jgi:hypothetical protein